METVELHQAFLWTCETCGKDSFARAVTLSREEAAELDEELRETATGTDGVWLMAPKFVVCPFCCSQFGTTGR